MVLEYSKITFNYSKLKRKTSVYTRMSLWEGQCGGAGTALVTTLHVSGDAKCSV